MMMSRKDIRGEAKDVVSRCGDIPLYTGDDEKITEITGFKLIRGALCAMRRREPPAVQELCRDAHRVAVLENVVNPTNLGVIFRSAAALNMDAVLLTENCTDPLYRRSLRVSMGTEGEGLLDSTIEACDYTVKIPMSNGVDSLNVAAASSVAFWQLGRSRIK